MLLAAALALLVTGIMAVILHPIPLSHNGLGPEGGSLLAPASDESLTTAIGDPNAPAAVALLTGLGGGSSGGSVAPAPKPKPNPGPVVPPAPPPAPPQGGGLFHILPKLPPFP